MRTIVELQLTESALPAVIAPAENRGWALAGTAADLLHPEISQAMDGKSRPVEAWRITTLAGGSLVNGTAQPSADALAQLRTLIAAAGMRGVKLLSLAPAPVCGEAAVRYADALNQTYLAMRAVIPDLERAGVQLALCAATHGFLMSPPELRDLIDRISSSCVGADITCGEGRDDRATVEDWLDTLGPRVFAVGIGSDAEETLVRAISGQGNLQNAVMVDRRGSGIAA